MYSPGVKVFIGTRKNGVVDVSDDLTRGSLTLNENAPHRFEFGLLNQGGKYNRVFTPNDRISVQMKRVRWLQVFAGYLNTVPIVSSTPTTAYLDATCSLKRIQMTYWNPGMQESVDLIKIEGSPSDNLGPDAGIAGKAKVLLEFVVDWNHDNIHIGEIPQGWMDKVTLLLQKVAARGLFIQQQVGAQASGGGMPGGGGPLTGADNEAKIWNYLISKGLSREQTAGLMGNLQQESGFDPGAQESGGTGIGIAQWSFGRADALRAAAGAGDWKDLGFQLDYLFNEASSRGDWDKLKQETTVRGACLSWQTNFEKSADSGAGLDRRVAYGDAILARH